LPIFNQQILDKIIIRSKDTTFLRKHWNRNLAI